MTDEQAERLIAVNERIAEASERTQELLATILASMQTAIRISQQRIP